MNDKNKYKIIENSKAKCLRSELYNYNFDKKTGYFERWGKTKDEKDDPQFSYVGPEIADIEIVEGKCSGNCPWCYKSNSIDQDIKYMNYETFVKIFNNLPRTLGQIAFGITDIDANPDFKSIVRYCRNNDYQYIIPNVTINGNNMTDEWYDFLVNNMGAVSVSHYSDDICFNAVNELTKRGMKQVNIHKLLSDNTYDSCIDLINKRISDDRLKDLNAIVFLSLKQKGDRNTLKPLIDLNKYEYLINYALDKKIGIGFDSCGSTKFLNFIDNNKKYSHFKSLVEPCESTCFSLYCNTQGKFFPCSFIEDEIKWENGLDLIKYNDFIKDIWYHEKTIDFRNNLLNKCRNCPYFKI